MCSEYARLRRRRWRWWWRRQQPCASEIWHYSLIDSHLPCLLKSHHYTTLSWLPSFLIYDYDLPRSHTFRVTDSNSCCLLPRTWQIKLHAEIGVGSVGRTVGLIGSRRWFRVNDESRHCFWAWWHESSSAYYYFQPRRFFSSSSNFSCLFSPSSQVMSLDEHLA